MIRLNTFNLLIHFTNQKNLNSPAEVMLIFEVSQYCEATLNMTGAENVSLAKSIQ